MFLLIRPMNVNNRRAWLQKLRVEIGGHIQRDEAHQQHIRGALNKDFDEQSLKNQSDDVIDLLDNDVRAELAQIENALSRVDARVGGHCKVCGELIEIHCLVALPHATRCNECAISQKNAPLNH